MQFRTALLVLYCTQFFPCFSNLFQIRILKPTVSMKIIRVHKYKYLTKNYLFEIFSGCLISVYKILFDLGTGTYHLHALHHYYELFLQ